MGRPSKTVQDFMAAYKIDSDEIWEVHGTTWVVKHKALERVAAEVGIAWEKPELKVCDMAGGMCVVLISGKLGERVEYSFGEAAPKNNKNSYPVAMAEKRAKDRVILKLLVTHGALYSESEADEFAEQPKRQNPHVTRAEDIFDGEVSGDIPETAAGRMKVADARKEFNVLVGEMARIQDADELKEWATARASIINSFPGQWPTMFRGEYTKHKATLTNGKAV